MKIKVIGCGNAFSNKNFNQSFLLEEEYMGQTRKMLIDCGSEVPAALNSAGIKITDINDIYISHLHADHVGGLERVAFLRYDWMNRPRKWSSNPESKKPPRLIANKQLLDDLWQKSLRGGLESMEGFVSNLETFFEPYPVEPNMSFFWQGWTVSLIQQIHIMSGSVIMPSFGIVFKRTDRKSVYFVTDSQHCSPRQIEEFYKCADIIIQDCELTGCDMRFLEGTQYYKENDKYYLWPNNEQDSSGMLRLELSAKGIEPEIWGVSKGMSGVHANYAQLAGYPSANSIKLSDDIKKKMWLSHYQDFKENHLDGYGNPVEWDMMAEKDGFAGFVKVGQEWEI
jgi:ribonuclease BN (tRNA processing enzyme)